MKGYLLLKQGFPDVLIHRLSNEPVGVGFPHLGDLEMKELMIILDLPLGESSDLWRESARGAQHS